MYTCGRFMSMYGKTNKNKYINKQCYTGKKKKKKNLPSNAGDIRDASLIPELGRSPGGKCGNAHQYSCLENLHGQRSLVGYSP